jgi:hypothetical protein
MKMKGLYKFEWDCGRNGNLEGLFIAEKADIEALVGTDVYFGEILGKHSEVQGEIEEDEITLITDDQAFIALIEEKIGEGTISGVNPLDYLRDE